MIIAVTGWRDYTDASFIRRQLAQFLGPYPLHIRVGDANGADAIAKQWCQNMMGIRPELSFHEFEAFRFSSGALMRGAGPRRNREMLMGTGDPVQGRTDLLLAFPRTDGKPTTVPGSGTWGCVIEAHERGIRVEIPAYYPSGD